jgi:hypothetical protein
VRTDAHPQRTSATEGTTYIFWARRSCSSLGARRDQFKRHRFEHSNGYEDCKQFHPPPQEFPKYLGIAAETPLFVRGLRPFLDHGGVRFACQTATSSASEGSKEGASEPSSRARQHTVSSPCPGPANLDAPFGWADLLIQPPDWGVKNRWTKTGRYDTPARWPLGRPEGGTGTGVRRWASSAIKRWPVVATEYGRSDTSHLGHAFAGTRPRGACRCDRRILAIAPWLRRWGATDARNESAL